MGQPAARLGDMHICPKFEGLKPHGGGVILPTCCPTVLIGGQPAARAGDKLVCVGPTDMIMKGSATVKIGGKAAARVGDTTEHYGVVTLGCPTVLIGDVCPTAAMARKNVRLPVVPQESVETCFICRQRLSEKGQHSADTAINTAAQNLGRMNKDYEHAKLSEHVYDTSKPPPDGWENISNDPAKLKEYGLTPEDLHLSGSPFKAQMYVPDPEIVGEDASPTVVFKGTEEWADWLENLKQGIFGTSDYYRRAIKIGEKFSASIGKSTAQAGPKVEFAGHSLGGGLASAAARASGSNATTFNAAGLHHNTVRNNTMNSSPGPADSPINAYRVRGDILTWIQEHSVAATAGAWSLFGPYAAAAKVLVSFFMPDAAGTKYDLPGSGISPLDRHGMDQVLAGTRSMVFKDQRILESAFGEHCHCED